MALANDQDLVTRLHWYGTNVQSDNPIVASLQGIVAESVAEIERLRAELTDCQHVRDNWCAAYTELRDQQKPETN